MTKKERFGIALFLAPLILPLWTAIERRVFDSRDFDPVGDIMIMTVTVFSYLEFFILGLPIILALRHFGKLTLLNLGVLGFLVGATLGQAFPFFVFGGFELKLHFDPAFFLPFGFIGIAVAIVFGLVAGARPY